jgi:membrane protein implicated in regulation of membrane protease activity
MNERKWSTRVLVRYTLLQLPGLAVLVIIILFVLRWLELPVWLIWGSIFVWVAKDVILYPFVWRAYDRPREEDVAAMIGTCCIAKERMAPSGYVLMRGELWKAEMTSGSPSVEKGERVRIREIRGLTLIVEPWDEDCEGV